METMRLQKFLGSAGVASRRKSEELILSGQIKVNDKIVTEMGIQIDPKKDIVEYNHQIIHLAHQYTYYILNKPRGYTTTCSDAHAEKTVLELLPPEPRVVPVGRLDKSSRGLLILTNDGELTNRLTHPKYEHEKEYFARALIESPQITSTQILQNEIKRLEKGIYLDGKITSPAKISKLDYNLSQKTIEFHITLKEGRNRQIRRMCDIIGLKVLDLQRVRIGKISLNNLPEGKFKKINIEEII